MSQNPIERKNKAGTIYYVDEYGEIVSKRCSKCNAVKILNGFPKQAKGLGGRASRCSECRSEINKDWRKGNKEYALETQKRWRENNKEHIQKYTKDNRQKINDRRNIWREQNRDKERERDRLWRMKNRNKIALKDQRRRARKNSLPHEITELHLKEILAHFSNGCALTGSKDYHWDHVIPISIGHGGTIYGNLIPLRSDLNDSKGTQNIFEWFESNRQRFDISQEKFETLIRWLGKANDMTVEDYRHNVYRCHENPRSIEALQNEDESEAI